MENKMKTSTVLKWVSGGLEAFLAIPFVGGTFVVGLLWTPLIAMLALHIVTLVFSSRENENKHGSILGIITSAIGWIPIVGWIMHVITAIFLLIDAYNATNKVKAKVEPITVTNDDITNVNHTNTSPINSVDDVDDQNKVD